MAKDFYGILNVKHNADSEKIRRAYRRAAKRCHPDVAPKGKEKFMELQEAYETLSDPEKRAIYDRQLIERAVIKKRIYDSSRRVNLASNLFDEIDHLVDYTKNLWSHDLSFSSDVFEAGLEGDFLEIILSLEEARKGCKIPLEISMLALCTGCKGTGRRKGLICGLCRGKGRIETKKEIHVLIPPGVRDGERFIIPEQEVGAERASLSVKIRVSVY